MIYGKQNSIQNVISTLAKIGQQYQEQEKTIEKLQQQIKNFKAEVYKDEELTAMKETYEKMKNDYYRGFPISKEEIAKINKWIKNHENTHHGGYPCYHGVSGGGYSYVFYPTAIGTAGEIVCGSCRKKALIDSKMDNKLYKQLLKDYDVSFTFQEL